MCEHCGVFPTGGSDADSLPMFEELRWHDRLMHLLLEGPEEALLTQRVARFWTLQSGTPVPTAAAQDRHCDSWRKFFKRKNVKKWLNKCSWTFSCLSLWNKSACRASSCCYRCFNRAGPQVYVSRLNIVISHYYYIKLSPGIQINQQI